MAGKFQPPGLARAIFELRHLHIEISAIQRRHRSPLPLPPPARPPARNRHTSCDAKKTKTTADGEKEKRGWLNNDLSRIQRSTSRIAICSRKPGRREERGKRAFRDVDIN